MLTQEENDLLTRTGPATPGGELLRRYWQPVALVEELPARGAPLPVRLLGEDLVLFRDDRGRPGLLGIHCSHRGADLSYGRLEDGGLRCIYHGWLYDIHGRCLEQPGEPAGSTFHEKIRPTAYPCHQAGGLILTYMGPGEPPLVPGFDILRAPEDRRFETKVYRECNYLQGNEGNIDAAHVSFVHWQGTRWPDPPSYDIVDAEPTNYGLRNYWIRRVAPGRSYVHLNNFIMPNIGGIGGGTGTRLEGYSFNWHVPIDDTHHWEYVINFRYKTPRPDDERWRGRREHHAELGPDYRIVRNLSNRYLQDREEMKTRTLAGLGTYFYAQDGYATETQGPIQDRTHEHLGFTDKAIVAERLMLLKAIADVQAGRDPVGVVRHPGENHFEIVVASEEIPRERDWRGYWRDSASPNT